MPGFPGAQGVPAPNFQQDTQVSDWTVNGNALVASGNEIGISNATINGLLRVNGTMLANNLTINAGGKVAIGTNGEITLGAFI